jgi:hypothetical protein
MWYIVSVPAAIGLISITVQSEQINFILENK